MELIIDTTQQDWLIICLAVLIILVTLSSVFIFKMFGLERWQVRKIGHMFVNTVAAFYPYLFTNFFDLIISLIIAIVILLLLSAIPPIRFLQRIFTMCSREENFPWELFINSVLMGITMVLILWFFRLNLFVFTAAYLTVSLGDGLGEMIGRPFGRIKYRIFSNKSLEGSFAVFVGSFLGLIIALGTNAMLGSASVWWKISVVALIAMVIEAFSISFSDNIALPTAVAVSLYLLFLI